MSEKHTIDDERGEGSGFVDTHSHLSFPEFSGDIAEVCERAWTAGVEQIITVGSGQWENGNRSAIELAGRDRRIFAAIGVHPHDADRFTPETLSDLVSLIHEDRVVAIGETGLDYFRMRSSKEAQEQCFRAQIKLAHQYHRPLIIHDRDAHEDVWRIIEEEGVPQRGGVFHCFSGDAVFAQRVVDAGFYISFAGNLTYPTSHELQGAAFTIPLENILVESDAPYLTPVPHRGKRNEPSFVVHTAQKIAEIKGLDVSDVARMTTLNAKRLFDLPGADMEPRIAYRIRNSLYLNITNRCNLQCTFCPKFTDDYEVKGHCLKLVREPDVEHVFQAMGNPETYDEVVFCGYGEPTKRIELVKELARRMKSVGVKKIRLNTDGLANMIYGRNVLAEFKGLIDSVSVSLNAQDGATYAKICPSAYGEKAYDAAKKFIKEAKDYIPEVIATIVNLPEVDVEICRKIAEEELGVKFRARQYMHVG